MSKSPAKEKDPLAVAIGRRVRDALNVRHMKQVDLIRASEKLGPPGWPGQFYDSTVSNIANGKRKPTPEQFTVLAQVLNVSIDWLATGKGRGPAPEDQGLHPATHRTDEIQEPGPADQGVRSGAVSSVGAAIEAYIRRQGREPDEDELRFIRGWFKAEPPPVIDDELIEGILKELRRSYRRGVERLASRGGDGGKGPTGS